MYGARISAASELDMYCAADTVAVVLAGTATRGVLSCLPRHSLSLALYLPSLAAAAALLRLYVDAHGTQIEHFTCMHM